MVTNQGFWKKNLSWESHPQHIHCHQNLSEVIKPVKSEFDVRNKLILLGLRKRKTALMSEPSHSTTYTMQDEWDIPRFLVNKYPTPSVKKVCN